MSHETLGEFNHTSGIGQKIEEAADTLSEKPQTISRDGGRDTSQAHDTKISNGHFLTLKKVERDFLKLLRNIIGDENRVPSHHSAYPLSQVPVHHRQFTISGVVNVEEILNSDFDLDNLQIGVDAIELRVRCEANLGDPNDSAGEAQLERIAEAFAKLRRSTIVPIILTALQVDSSSGSRRKSQLHLMSYCFRLGPEYCTIDLKLDQSDLETLVAARGHTNIIGTYNLPERSPDGWNDPKLLSLYEGAASLGCHIVKITMPADSINDNFPVHSFQQKVEALRRDVRLIAYNSGKKGRPSMCFNTCLTPVKSRRADQTDNEFDHDDVLVTAHEIFTALFSAFIYEPTEFFIYGANVSYSLSPAMHNTAYRALGMPHTYRAHSSSTLDDFRGLSREESFGGAAIVQPYKTVVIALLKGLSSHAKAIGSVNTILPVRELADDGSIPDELRLFSQLNRRGPVKALYGHNTDWIGIRACLRRGLSPANTVRPQSSALVCGAGGMARSAIYSMLSLGVRNVFICNRTVANAQKLANHYNKLIDDVGISELDPSNAAHTRVRILDTFDAAWPKEYRHPTLIVSSIPTQSADGSPTNFVLPDDWLRSPTGGVVVELAYRAMVTPVVQQIRPQAHRGWVLMDGFDILPEQAYAQFELFTGRRAPRKLMREQVIKHYREQEGQSGSKTVNLNPHPSASYDVDVLGSSY